MSFEHKEKPQLILKSQGFHRGKHLAGRCESCGRIKDIDRDYVRVGDGTFASKYYLNGRY